MASTARLMPRPHNRDAPQFEGKRIKRFLKEFEALADAATLSKDECCRYIVRYCKGKAEEFIESLEEYEDNDWDALKKKLEESYPSEEEERHYTRKSLSSFYRQSRTISDMASFDKYLWLSHKHWNGRK
jgi:hypothetical protein